MRRYVAPLLALLCLLLAGALAALWFDPAGNLRNVYWQAPSPRQPDFATMAPVMPSQVPSDASQFVATLERPLFSPSRRPPPPKAVVAAAPVAASPAPDPLANVQILGIYEGDRRGGIIARIDGKARRLNLNDRIGEWTISSIRGREVTFSHNGEDRFLSLVTRQRKPADKDAAPSVATAPAAPAQVAEPAPISGAGSQNIQQEQRERLQRLNAMRARMGLPPYTE